MEPAVIAETYEQQVLTFGNKPGDITFVINGSAPEKSWPDCAVFFKFEDTYTWLRAEEAIELGQTLIKHGTRALRGSIKEEIKNVK